MDFSVPISYTDGSKAGAGLDWLGAAVSVGESIYNNSVNKDLAAQNLQFQRETNQLNKEFTQVAWARDDTAVARRVRDLKNSGLSPLLAAGSAAGNTNPIQLHAPHNDYQRQNTISNVLPALAAVESIKGQKLDNNLKALQARYYGLPDWLIGIQRIIGEVPHDNILYKGVMKIAKYFGLVDEDGNVSVPKPVDDNPTPCVKTVDYSRRTTMPVNNKWSMERLEEKGIDTTPPSLESHPKDFGITNSDLIQDGTHFIEQLRSDGKLTKQNVEMIANTLGKRYNQRKGDIFEWLMSLAGL